MQGQFLTVAASALMVSAAAMGDMDGVDITLVGVNLVDPATAGGENYTVDVWAQMNTANRLDAVAGNSSTTKLITTGGTFWQSGFAGALSTANNEAFWASFPSMEFDSFITIGCWSSGCAGLDNTLQTVGIDFSEFEAGGDMTTSNGTWFVTPDQPIGDSVAYESTCGSANGVLVARLTVVGLDSTLEFSALFQGREGDSTWQYEGYAAFAYNEVEYADCNGNGVLDGCDFINGDLNDDNGDGVYDECEFYDCNKNGINDADEIADGTAEDCNLNGVPDDCDLGESADCNMNGIPDECEADCNGNDVADDCDIANGEEEDCNDNGIPDSCDIANGGDANGNGELDECEVYPYVNLNSSLVSDTAAEAIFAADNGDSIEAMAEFFNAETSIDMLGKSLYMSVTEGDGATSASVTMGPGAVLDAGMHVNFYGPVFSSFSGTSQIKAAHHMEMHDLTFVRSGASLELNPDSHAVTSDSVINSGGALASLAPLTMNGATTMLGDAMLLAANATNNGLLRSSGTILADVSNTVDAEIQCGGDTVLSGNLDNDGTVSVNVGTLYILGGLTNNGTIVGDVDQGPGFTGGDEPAPGDGFAVGGSYTAGADASLHMPHANWTISIGGNVDIAIDDNDRFTMEEATMALTGAAGSLQYIEAMSVDVDSSTDGLDSTLDGHFTIGQLVVRSGAAALVVDNHDNAEGGAESIYVKHLVVEAGATLDAGDRAVWYETAEINGTIVGDIDVVADPCPGDADGNDVVNIDDLLLVIGTFGEFCDGCPTDFDGSGQITIDDLLVVIGFFGPCE